MIARSFMQASTTTFLPTFTKMETGNMWLAGAALTVFEAAGVLGVLVSGSASDRFGRRVLVLLLLGAPLSLILFVFSGGWFRLMGLAFTGATLLSTTPIMLAMVQEHAGENPAAANGFYMMISFGTRSAVVVAVGFIADHIGLHATYLVSAGLALTGLPFVLSLPEDVIEEE